MDYRARIEELRSKVDAIDVEVVDKLNRRAELALEIKSVKDMANIDLYDPKREEDIYAHILEANKGPMYDDGIRSVFEQILKEMKSLESR